MLSIDTNVDTAVIEVDGEVYAVADKTIAIAEELIAAQKRCAGQPQYKLWLAELEVLLGKDSVRRLFCAGRAENLDRMERIHAGAVAAFERNHDSLSSEQALQNADRIALSLAPLNELLRRLSLMDKDGDRKVIRRG